MQRIPLLAAALWWGSLGAIGFMAVPLLFAALPDKALAGSAAARLFQAQSWLSVACGMLLLVSTSNRGAARATPGRNAIVFIVAGLLLALLGEYAVAPRIVARQNLALWHAVGTGMYLAQWACALGVLWRLARGPGAGATEQSP